MLTKEAKSRKEAERVIGRPVAVAFALVPRSWPLALLGGVVLGLAVFTPTPWLVLLPAAAVLFYWAWRAEYTEIVCRTPSGEILLVRRAILPWGDGTARAVEPDALSLLPREGMSMLRRVELEGRPRSVRMVFEPQLAGLKTPTL